jgi:CDP-glycerol glycerophosphotransferase
MRLDRRSPRAYWAHAKALAALLAARVLGPKRPRGDPRPEVFLYGNVLGGNLKAFLDYALSRSDLPYAASYATIDRREYRRLRRTYDRGVALATRVSVMRRILAAPCLLTMTGPGLFLLLRKWRPSVQFVDVWHGLPLKALAPAGFRVMDFYRAFLVSSPYFKRIYTEWYGFPAKKVFVTGYARMDVFQRAAETRRRVRRELGLTDDAAVVLYAPTWRPAGEGGEIPFGLSAAEFLAALNALAEELNAWVIFRLHINSRLGRVAARRRKTGSDPLMSFRWGLIPSSGPRRGCPGAYATSYPRILNVPQSAYPEANDLLAATDLLITDWSSIACDFYALSRPVVFVDTPAPADYASEYRPVERVGPLVRDLPALLAATEENLHTDPAQIAALQGQVRDLCYGSTLDGRSAERYDQVIRNVIST